MKKIITCAPLPPPHGGITNWYRILEEDAQKNGYSLLNINTSPRKIAEQRTLFYRIFVQGCHMIKQHGEIIRLIRKNREVRVAHITTSGRLALIRDVLFLRLFRGKGIRTVYHVHFGRIPEIFDVQSAEYRLLRKAISIADATIAIDPKTCAVLQNLFGVNKIFYIPNPVNRVYADTSEARNEILFLGSVCKEKGIEELLKVWETLADKYPNWKVTLIGHCEDTYRAFLEKTFSLQNVEFSGFLPHDDAMERLAHSSFLVLPSYTEGFPNVVIEAMMCSKAVVATDVGAIADILSGECGIVIPPQNVLALQNGMEKLICDVNMRDQMAKRGKEKALSHYISDMVFREYIKIWEGLGRS